jgi:hypothetical protein
MNYSRAMRVHAQLYHTRRGAGPHITPASEVTQVAYQRTRPVEPARSIYMTLRQRCIDRGVTTPL